MKCSEPRPDSTYQECQRDLRHSGQHDYLGTKWSRPEPAEPDPNVEALLSKAAGLQAWDLEDREYPVVVEVTTRYVMWVSAPSEDDALAYYGDDPTDISLSGEVAIDGSIEVQRMDRFDYPEALATRHHGEAVGPKLQCPDCKALSFTRSTFHNPYRRCHGPITWRPWPSGKGVSRDYVTTPMPARKAVGA